MDRLTPDALLFPLSCFNDLTVYGPVLEEIRIASRYRCIDYVIREIVMTQKRIINYTISLRLDDDFHEVLAKYLTVEVIETIPLPERSTYKFTFRLTIEPSSRLFPFWGLIKRAKKLRKACSESERFVYRLIDLMQISHLFDTLKHRIYASPFAYYKYITGGLAKDYTDDNIMFSKNYSDKITNFFNEISGRNLFIQGQIPDLTGCGITLIKNDGPIILYRR